MHPSLVVLGVQFILEPLCSPRTTVVLNRCSPERCCRSCPNPPPRRSIARVRKLGFASSRALLFGYALA